MPVTQYHRADEDAHASTPGAKHIHDRGPVDPIAEEAAFLVAALAHEDAREAADSQAVLLDLLDAHGFLEPYKAADGRLRVIEGSPSSAPVVPSAEEVAIAVRSRQAETAQVGVRLSHDRRAGVLRQALLGAGGEVIHASLDEMYGAAEVWVAGGMAFELRLCQVGELTLRALERDAGARAAGDWPSEMVDLAEQRGRGGEQTQPHGKEPCQPKR